MKYLVFAFTLILSLQTLFAQNTKEQDFKKQFQKHGVDGCFVLYNQTNDEFIKYNSKLCETGYIPASTFKIPHSLIALEEGIVKDTNETIEWNGKEWPHKVWNKNQTLITAVKYSCIWVYFKFAEQIGIKKYYEYVNAFNYGNKDLTGPPTRFWLSGKFRISANQQIEFLRKFYNYELKTKKENVDKVKELIVLEETEAYKFSGKTGGGELEDNKHIMWLVGYIEKEDDVCFYAMNFVANDFKKTSKARYTITKDILKELKLMD